MCNIAYSIYLVIFAVSVEFTIKAIFGSVLQSAFCQCTTLPQPRFGVHLGPNGPDYALYVTKMLISQPHLAPPWIGPGNRFHDSLSVWCFDPYLDIVQCAFHRATPISGAYSAFQHISAGSTLFKVDLAIFQCIFDVPHR